MNKSSDGILNIKQNVQTDFKLIPLESISTRAQAHRHDFFVLIYVKEGTGLQHLDYEEVTIAPQRLYFIAPNAVHLWRGNCKGYTLMFSTSYIQNGEELLDTLFIDFKKDNHIEIPPEYAQEFDALMEILASRYDAQNSASRLVHALVYSLLCYCKDLKQMQYKQTHTLQDMRILETKKLIEQHYKENLSIEIYAKKLSLTPQHLNRILKHYTGKTLAILIKERRVLEAKRELVFTHKTIDAIGTSLGFFDASNFSKYFKSHTSISPSYFRKMFKYYH